MLKELKELYKIYGVEPIHNAGSDNFPLTDSSILELIRVLSGFFPFTFAFERDIVDVKLTVIENAICARKQYDVDIDYLTKKVKPILEKSKAEYLCKRDEVRKELHRINAEMIQEEILEDMTPIKKDIFLVVKREDIDKYLTYEENYTLTNILAKIEECRLSDSKKLNSYYVCNADESYADSVLQTILAGEKVKWKQ